MPDKQIRFYVMAYDISDPRRLQKVHKLCKKFGMPMQYSVFIVPLNRLDKELLLMELTELINEKQDDVRIYPLPEHSHAVLLGKQFQPDGVFITVKDRRVGKDL